MKIKEIQIKEIKAKEIQKTDKRNLLFRKATEPGMILLLSFLLPVVIMLTLFVLREIYPFGDRSFLFSDMYHQYMPFFAEMIRKVKSGEGLAYSYNVGAGSNFLALYAYYLASPLNWVGILVPERYLVEFLSYLVVVKIGLGGLTAAHYLQKRFGTGDFGIVLFACFYALSGYMAAYNWNIMWLDGVVLLPLILLGLERLVKEDRCGLYCGTLALAIFIDFYISIMICIFLVLYFVTLLVREKRSFRIVGNFVLYSMLAGGMAAVLLIPSICSVLATDFGGMDFPEKLESYFSILDILTRHCMCISAERGLEHWPNIYCGVAAFLLVPLYVMNNKISIRERFVNLALAGVLLLSFGTNLLDFIWHGFNFPNSLPARQSFIYIFLVLVMCYEAWKRIKETEEKQILHGYLAAILFVLFIEKFVVHEDFSVLIEFLTLLFVTVYAVLLHLYCTRQNEKWKQIVGMLALVAVIAESSINMGWTSIGTVSRSGYLGQQADYKALYQETQLQEAGFYRVEKFTRKTKNDGTLTGYPTATVFSSTMNSGVMDMYQQLGMRHSKVYYSFDGATGFTSALMNVGYMFGETDGYEGELYRLLGQSGEVFLYENTMTLPFGYVAPVGYDFPGNEQKGASAHGDSDKKLHWMQKADTDKGPERSVQAVKLQNELVEMLGIEGSLLEPVNSDSDGEDVRLEVKEDGVYYGRVSAGGTGEIKMTGGPLEEQHFDDLKDEALLYLGQLEKGERITLTNGDEEDSSQEIAVEIYRLDTEVLRQVLEVLSAQHMTDVEYDSTTVSGKLSLKSAGRLILSIPYEAGWSVRINGEKTKPQIFGGALMAFDLEPGEYEVNLQYVPAGSRAGIVVSIVSCVLLAVLLAKKRTH